MTRMTFSAHHAFAIVTSLAALAFLGCDQTGPAAPEVDAQFSHKPNHGGGGGGKGGGGSSPTLAWRASGGMETGGSAFDLTKVSDSEGAINATTDGSFTAQMNLANTYAYAAGDPFSICTLDLDRGFPDQYKPGLTETLLAELLDASPVTKELFFLNVEKAGDDVDGRAVENVVRLNDNKAGDGDVLGVAVGKGGGAYGFPLVTYHGPVGSINDPSATRVFTFRPSPPEDGGPGTVWVIKRFPDPDKPNRPGPIAKLFCPFQSGDEVTVTVAPSTN